MSSHVRRTHRNKPSLWIKPTPPLFTTVTDFVAGLQKPTLVHPVRYLLVRLLLSISKKVHRVRREVGRKKEHITLWRSERLCIRIGVGVPNSPPPLQPSCASAAGTLFFGSEVCEWMFPISPRVRCAQNVYCVLLLKRCDPLNRYLAPSLTPVVAVTISSTFHNTTTYPSPEANIESSVMTPPLTVSALRPTRRENSMQEQRTNERRLKMETRMWRLYRLVSHTT